MTKRLFFCMLVFSALSAGAFGMQTANPPAPRAPSADPYASNAAAGTTAFPLAAPAGTDSNARAVPPPGAVNQGAFDPATWKYGPAFDSPAGSKSGIP